MKSWEAKMTTASSRNASSRFRSMPGSDCGLLYSGIELIGPVEAAAQGRNLARPDGSRRCQIPNRIIAAFGQRMATQDSPQGHRRAAQGSITSYRFGCVFRTRRNIAAGGGKK